MRWPSLPPVLGCLAVAALAMPSTAHRDDAVRGSGVAHAVARPLAAAQRIGEAGMAAPALAAPANLPTEEVHFPDGTVGVRVARQYFHTVVICRHADGRYDTQCPEHAP
jgi:hypothetical protein